MIVESIPEDKEQKGKSKQQRGKKEQEEEKEEQSTSAPKQTTSKRKHEDHDDEENENWHQKEPAKKKLKDQNVENGKENSSKRKYEEEVTLRKAKGPEKEPSKKKAKVEESSRAEESAKKNEMILKENHDHNKQDPKVVEHSHKERRHPQERKKDIPVNEKRERDLRGDQLERTRNWVRQQANRHKEAQEDEGAFIPDYVKLHLPNQARVQHT